MGYFVSWRRHHARMETPPPAPQALIDITQVARLIGACPRTVRRRYQADLMPRPMKLGRHLRWSYLAIQAWIDDGCPPPTSPPVG